MLLTLRARQIWEPALWFAGLLVIWETSIHLFHVSPLLLPAPSDSFAAMYREGPYLLQHGLVTTRLVIYGFVAGAIPGMALGYRTGFW